jgi:hypothetical protein
MEEVIILISVAVSLLVLITYFVLTSNVGQIKRAVVRNESHFDDYIKHLSFGNKEAALNSLNEFIWVKLKNVQLRNLVEPARSEEYNDVKAVYEKYYHQIGAEFPKMLKYKDSSFIIIE